MHDKKNENATGPTIKVKVIHAGFRLDATAGVHTKLLVLIKSDKPALGICIANIRKLLLSRCVQCINGASRLEFKGETRAKHY